jgi:hypothetical protein
MQVLLVLENFMQTPRDWNIEGIMKGKQEKKRKKKEC